MAKLPATQWYIGDWKKDAALSMCSISTRGFWFEILGAMHELNRCGIISGTVQQLARIARCLPEEAADAINELDQTGAANVTQKDGVFTLINRRMHREFKEREGAKIRMEKMRKKTNLLQNVTESYGNVTQPENIENIEDTDETKVSYEKVTFPSSSSSSISVTEDKEKVTEAVTKKKATTAKKSIEKLSDDDWLDSLEANPIYKHVHIRIEFEKARIWCETNNRQNTRNFFVNWINRIQAPIQSLQTINGGKTSNEPKQYQTTKDRNEQRAIDEHNKLESIRAQVDARRAGRLQN